MILLKKNTSNAQVSLPITGRGNRGRCHENQIDEATKQERYHRLMALQAKISEEIQQEREGKVLTVLVEGHDEKNPDLAVARSYAEAPDIDGKIFIEGARRYS